MTMELRGGVLVGIGDEYEAVPEIDWGAREALARGVALQVVRVFHRSQFTRPWNLESDVPSVAEIRADALRRLRAATDHVHREWPALTVRAEVVEGVPWQVLVDASADADVTVLGSRQLGAVTGLLLGSVSGTVAARAEGPVVVVRSGGRIPVGRPEVVVGLDGAPGHEDVLAFAFDHARRHRCRLEAVVCRDEPFQQRLAPTAERTATAGHWLTETVGPWLAKYSDVEVRETVLVAHPVAGLVELSLGQALLVVGAGRGRHGPLARLGSVTQGVLHHAQCAVAVVPSEAEVTR